MAITIPILTDFNGKGLTKAKKQFKSLETNGQKAQFALRKAAIPAALALAAVGGAIIGATKAAIEDQASSQQLARTLGKVTNATKAQINEVEAYIGAMERATNVGDMELRPSLALLSTATGSLEKGQKGLALALDIAAGTGQPLAAVSEGLSKAYAGNLRGLTRLDPRMKELIANGATAEEAMAVLAKTFKGDAAAATKTAEGRMKGMSIAIGEAQESIGHALLPAIEKLLPVLLKFTRFLQDNPKVLIAVVAGVAALAGGIMVLNVTMAILAANPVALVVIAIVIAVAALTVGIILLYKRSETFQKIVTNAWEVVQAAVRKVVDYLKGPVMAAWDIISGAIQTISALVKGDFSGAWEGLKKTLGGVFDWIKTTILALPIILATAALDIGKAIVGGIADGVATLGETVWDKVKGLAAFLWDKALSWATGLKGIAGDILGWMTDGLGGFAGEIWGKISGFADELVRKVAGLAGKIKGIGKDIVGWVGDGIETAWTAVVKIAKDGINLVINAINGGIKSVNLVSGVINKVVPFGDPVPKIDMIPKLAAGGIVTRPTLALIGEAGPEAVIPLSGRNAPGGMGGITITVNAGLVSTPDQIGQQIIEAIQKAQRRSGPVFAAA